MHSTLVPFFLPICKKNLLFKRPVVHNVGVTALTNASFFQSRFVVTGLVSFSLRRTATKSLSVGALFAIVPQDAMHTVLELKTGILYQYGISPKTVLGIKGGMFPILRSKLLDSNGNASDAFI